MLRKVILYIGVVNERFKSKIRILSFRYNYLKGRVLYYFVNQKAMIV
jgi:hypothetical protein